MATQAPARVRATPAVRFATILVATDFSAASEAALRFASALARRQNSKLFLAHVLGFEPGYPKPMQPAPALSGDENQANILLAQALKEPGLSGITREALLCRGELWPMLEANIRAHAIDLVVVGTHGRDGLSKLLLGSVAEQVFRQSPCPVLTVGPHAELDTLADGGFRRVLYATNFSPSSLHALPFAVSLAEQHLTLLHVLAADLASAEFGATVFQEEEYAAARQGLRRLIPPDSEADTLVEAGLPASTIVRVAREQNASLIVMGVDPSSRFAATHLPWATAHRVLCDAPCPVLTVR